MDAALADFVRDFGGAYPLTMRLAVTRLVDAVDAEGHYLELTGESGSPVCRRLRLRLRGPGRLTLFVTGKHGYVCVFDELALTCLPKEDDWDLFRFQLDAAQLDEELNVKFHALEVLENTPLDRE